MISHSYSKHKAMGNERKLIKKYLASGKHLKVLELGSGYGSFASLCKEFNVDYTGIDMGQEGIKYCNTQYPQKNFRFIQSEIVSFLKNEENEYDLIFMSHVFEHLSVDDNTKVLKLIKKRLKKNGRFINIMPNPHAYFNALWVSPNCYLAHQHLYNTKDFSYLLKNAGFKTIKHKNLQVGNNIFERLIHKITLIIFNILINILGYETQNIYTTAYFSEAY